MFNKIEIFKERIMIPKRVNDFIETLNNAGKLSLNEIQASLDNIDKLQEDILKHKGKLKNERELDYATLIVDLRWKLMALYDDKEKEKKLSESTTKNVKKILAEKAKVRKSIKKHASSIKATTTKYKELVQKQKFFNNSFNIKPKKQNNKVKYAKGELEVALFAVGFKIKSILGTIKDKVKPIKKNNGNNISKLVRNVKDQTEIVALKVKTDIDNFIEPKSYKLSQKTTKNKSKLKKWFTNLKGDIEVFLFAAKYKSRVFIEDCQINIKKRFESLKNKKSNKNAFIRTALIALMLALGIGGGIAAKKHFDDNKTDLTNKNTIEYETNDEIIDNTEDFDDLLVNSFINKKPTIDNNNSNLDDELNLGKTDEPEPLEPQDDEMEPEIPTEPIEENNTNNISIGSNINIEEGSSIYTNMYDTYLNENELVPLYSDSELTRTVTSIIVSNGNEIKNINNNQELSSYLDNNYEIVGCSVTNNYSNNNSIEGYYRLDSIKTTNIQKTLR